MAFAVEEVGAVTFADVCPNAETPNRGLIAVADEVATCPKTLPANNPVDVPPLDCPNTDGEPKDEAGCTPLAGAGLPKLDCPKTVVLAVVEVVEVGWPNTLCPKEDEKGPAVVITGWPNKLPVAADVVTGRPKIVAGVLGVRVEGVLVVATISPRAD